MVDEPVVSELRIYDVRDLLVARVLGDSLSTDTERVILWDGTDMAGNRVPQGEYRYTLAACSLEGIDVVYDMTDLSGGKRSVVQNIRWNADGQLIEYDLLKPSRVDIRVGLSRGGPLLKTVLRSVPRSPGSQAEPWDGLDEQDVFELGLNPSTQIGIVATVLSINTIMVPGKAAEPVLIEPIEWPIERRLDAVGANKNIRRARNASLDLAGIDVELKMPSTPNWNAGKVAIGFDVAEEHRMRVAELRFEAGFYVDGILVYENEIGYLPMTWYWNTAGLSPGDHYLTVNLIGYEGNIGIRTLRVTVPELN